MCSCTESRKADRKRVENDVALRCIRFFGELSLQEVLDLGDNLNFVYLIKVRRRTNKEQKK
jgi:hypothetical protein